MRDIPVPRGKPMGLAVYYLTKARECAAFAELCTDELEARLFRAFEDEFLQLAADADEGRQIAMPPTGS